MEASVILGNVRKYAKEKQLTIRALEMKSGLANGVIAKWDIYSPNVGSLIAVAKTLDVSLDDLVKE